MLMINSYPRLPVNDVNSQYKGYPANRQVGVFDVPQNVQIGAKFERKMIYDRIKSIEGKGNLDIWTDCLVTKILFDGNKNAVGVEFLKGKHLYEASPKFSRQNLKTASQGHIYSKSEVILGNIHLNFPDHAWDAAVVLSGQPRHVKTSAQIEQGIRFMTRTFRKYLSDAGVRIELQRGPYR